jgi:hypothetical protein
MTWSIQTPGDEEVNALAESRTHIDLQENIHTRLNWLEAVARGTQIIESVDEVLEQFAAVMHETRQMYAQAGVYQDGILAMKEQRDMALLDAHEAKTKGASMAKKDFACELAARYSLSPQGAKRIIDYLFGDSDFIPSQYTISDLDRLMESLDRELLEDAIELEEYQTLWDEETEWEPAEWNE